jgi:hypothetical protein
MQLWRVDEREAHGSRFAGGVPPRLAVIKWPSLRFFDGVPATQIPQGRKSP